MCSKYYFPVVSFFSAAAILGTYTSYLHILSTFAAVVVVLLSLAIAFLVYLQYKSDGNIDRVAVLSAILLLALLIAASLPNLIFPHLYGDFANHASYARITSEYGLDFGRGYPGMYTAASAIFYFILPNSHIVTTLLGVSISVLILLGLFGLAKQMFGRKVAFLASMLYSVSVPAVWLLEQGALPQLFGTMFFISALYALKSEKRIPFILATAATLAYPHLFLILMLIVLFFYRSFLLHAVFANLLALPEIISLAAGILGRQITGAKGGAISFLLIGGGIATPNFFMLLAFLPAAFVILNPKNLRANKLLFGWFSITAVLMLIVASFVLVNNFFIPFRPKDVHYLYMVVKLFYFLLPLFAIFAAIGLNVLLKRKKRIFTYGVVFLVLFSLAYSSYYALGVLPKKSAIDSDYLMLTEDITKLPDKPVVGVDLCLLNKTWNEPFLYKPLLSPPSKSNYFTRIVANRALETEPKEFVNKNMSIIASENYTVYLTKAGCNVGIDNMQLIKRHGNILLYAKNFIF